jgi:hypothetical protein
VTQHAYAEFVRATRHRRPAISEAGERGLRLYCRLTLGSGTCARKALSYYQLHGRRRTLRDGRPRVSLSTGWLGRHAVRSVPALRRPRVPRGPSAPAGS